MDKEGFFSRGINEKVDHFEKMLESGESFFFDTDELEEIIEFYLDYNLLSKAKNAIEYGQSLYPFELFYQLKTAHIHLASRNVKKAIEVMEKAKEKDPNNSDVARMLGDCYTAGMKYKKALECYQFALKLEGNQDDLHLSIAKVTFLLSNPKKAMAHLNKISPSFFEDEFSFHEIMKMFFEFDLNIDAIQFINSVIDSNPYNYQAWYYLGSTYQKMEKYDEAINAYEYCTAIDEKNTLGYLGVGTCLMELDRFELAIVNFKVAMENHLTDAEILCNIAECFENLEDFTQAKYYYMKAIKKDKYLSDAFYGLAIVYKKLNRLRDAEKNLKKAVELDEFESMYHVEIAEVYLLMDSKDNSLNHYKRALEIDPDVVEIALDYAHAHFEFKEVEKSIVLLNTCLEKGMEDHRIYYRIASYLFYAGHFEKGYNYLHAALEKNNIEYFLLYEYAPFLENNITVTNIIDLYLKK